MHSSHKRARANPMGVNVSRCVNNLAADHLGIKVPHHLHACSKGGASRSQCGRACGGTDSAATNDSNSSGGRSAGTSAWGASTMLKGRGGGRGVRGHWRDAGGGGRILARRCLREDAVGGRPYRPVRRGRRWGVVT